MSFPCGVQGGTDSRCGLRYQLRDGGCGDETPASEDDAGELAGAEEGVNGIAGDPAQPFAGFRDGIQIAIHDVIDLGLLGRWRRPRMTHREDGVCLGSCQDYARAERGAVRRESDQFVH